MTTPAAREGLALLQGIYENTMLLRQPKAKASEPVVSAGSREPARPSERPYQDESQAFATRIDAIGVGEKCRTRDGREFTVVDFKRFGLVLKAEDGSTETLAPMNPNLPRTQWVFEVQATH